jgi:uncharacterized protein (TIGR03790 family)
LTASARYSNDLTVESVTYPGEVDAFNYSDVLLLINDNSQMSKDVGEYFAAARGIPPERMAYLDVPDQEFITPEQFTDLKGKVKSYMVEHELVNDINYMVTTKGFPLSVYSSSGFTYGSCVDEELALIFGSLESQIGNFYAVSNPYYGQDAYFTHGNYPMYIVNRLTGYNWSDVKALIDHANSTYGNRGLFVLDADPSKNDGNGYEVGNQWLRDARDILSERSQYVDGIEVLFDESYWYITQQSEVMGYASWGSNDANDTDNAKPHNTWVNGSLAETFVSTGGRTFRWPPSYGQSLIADWIREGVTGIKGYVQEPFLTAIAHPDILFERYTRGYNLGESYRMASVMLGWMGVVVGDPKVSAFRDVPDVALDSAHVTVSNATPAEGDPLVVRAVVDNLGGRVEAMPVTLYVDGEASWQGNATFDTFSRTTIAINLTAPMTEGPHDVSVVLNTYIEAEDRLEVFETTGTNNGGSTSIDVRKRPVIELHVEPASALTQESLQFTIDVTNTTRPITDFYFDFWDGTPVMDWNVPAIMHSFLDNGVYKVRARVIDTQSVLSLWASVDVTITNRAPVATIAVSPGEALTGVGMDFCASRSTDADGIVSSVHWDLGDGNASDDWALTHAYRWPGEYLVTLTATDNDGATGTASRRVTALNRPPVAAFVLDGQVARKNHQTRLDASASADPDGRIVQYEWDFGDGTEGEVSRSPWVVHVFPRAGLKNVTLGVIDDVGARGRVTLAVEVTNELPVAELALSREVVLTGNPVGLDASRSQDTDGTVVWYEFTVSGGTGQPVVVHSGDAPTAEYVPTDDGRYTITVTVRDDDGGLANRTASLDVLDRPPLAFLDAATAALDGKVLTAPASVPVSVEATDPDGTIRSIQVLIDGVPYAEQNGSGSYTISILFSKEGHIELWVVVTDDDGSAATLGVNFTVNEVPHALFSILLDGSPAIDVESFHTGAAITLDADRTTDAAGSQLTYNWDFGDGSKLEGRIVDHTYLQPGTYTVTLTVKDGYGAQDDANADIVVTTPREQQGIALNWPLAIWIVGLVLVAAVVIGYVLLRRRGPVEGGKEGA